jgi:hypothetical protein
MRNLVAACGLLAGALAVLAQSPPKLVHAEEQATPPKPSPKIDAPAPQSPTHPASSPKTEKIRQLMEVTGAKNMGQELMKAGMEQLRVNVTESHPNNPRATQFVDAFVAQFPKHFKPQELNEKVLPIYDKYLSDEDVAGLLDYYRSALGQRMLKVLPQVAQESQALGFSLGQKAAQETLEELRKEFPEFVPDSHAPDADKGPGTGTKKE